MLFSSNVFIFFFLPVALIGYQLLGRFGRRAVFGWLSLVSLFFYGYWNPKYLFLLGASILLNFIASRVIARVASERAKTTALVAAITGNLLLLFWFKYLFPLLALLPRRRLALTRLRQCHPSARHLLLHLHADRLPHRSPPGRGRAAKPALLPPLRQLLPASHRRPHHSSLGDDAAV